MFKFCLAIMVISLLGMAVGGFLSLDPPLISLETLEIIREWLITLFCVAAVGLLIFKPKNGLD
jgi:hypothetical protein